MSAGETRAGEDHMDAWEKNYGEDDSTECAHEDRAVVTRDGQPVLVCWTCDYVFPEDE